MISRDVGINEQQQTPFFSLFLIRDESACFDLLPIIGRDQYVAEKVVQAVRVCFPDGAVFSEVAAIPLIAASVANIPVSFIKCLLCMVL